MNDPDGNSAATRITTTFEQLFPNDRIALIEATTIPMLPRELLTFTLIITAKNCEHSPPCQVGAVVLLRNDVCAIVGEGNYDGLELMAAQVLAEDEQQRNRMAEQSNRRQHKKKRRQNGRRTRR